MGRKRSELADLKVTPTGSTPETETPQKPRRRPRRRTLWLIGGLLAAFVVYAYGFQVTRVNLDTIRDETRQARLFNVIRALAQPDLLTYEVVDTDLDLDFAMPCPATGFDPAAAFEDPSFTVSPPCADPRGDVTISGQGFRPNDQATIFFVPPNGTELRIGVVRAGGTGSWETTIILPNRPDDQTQTIRVRSRANLGSIFSPVYIPTGAVDPDTGEAVTVRSPRWSTNAVQTLDRIIETIFLALLATTLGTVVAVPLSFLAARNLMSDVRIPGLNVGLAIAGFPLGAALALASSRMGAELVGLAPGSALILGAATAALAWAGVLLLRKAVPVPGAETSRLARIASGIGSAAAFLLGAQALVRLAIVGGGYLAPRLGTLDFLGRFIATSGEIFAAAFGVLSAIAGALFVAFLASRLSYAITKRVPESLNRVLTVAAMALGGAVVGMGVGLVVGWLYELNNVQSTVVTPGLVGAFIGLSAGVMAAIRGQLGAGLGIYYIARTVFNTLRSIEALVLALVFVVWVGLGPFAGALALGLHTIAANAKLYSEQVESIASGPLEAVRATGATRLQTVVYAVIPQIVAPYISFTMYRWDINVRMSTIIGFVGGGGIGFLLQQNINLLNYRAAAAQMLAIAIVVAAMDYMSSRLRERFV